MISFADALTTLSRESDGHPAHVAMLLASALASRRDSLPPVTEPDAWNLSEEEVQRARNMLIRPSDVHVYLPAAAPHAEPEHLAAGHVAAGDQLYCEGDMFAGHHKPGWCTVTGAEATGFGMSCGRRWTVREHDEALLVSRQRDAALAS